MSKWNGRPLTTTSNPVIALRSACSSLTSRTSVCSPGSCSCSSPRAGLAGIGRHHFFEACPGWPGHGWSRGRPRRRRPTRWLACGPNLLADRHHLDVGHVFHGEAHALAAQPALPVAAVGHVVGAEGRRVVDDHAAEVQPPDRLKHPVDVAGEDRRPAARTRCRRPGAAPPRSRRRRSPRPPARTPPPPPPSSPGVTSVSTVGQ